jgi:hypothetical protein
MDKYWYVKKKLKRKKAKKAKNSSASRLSLNEVFLHLTKAITAGRAVKNGKIR